MEHWIEGLVENLLPIVLDLHHRWKCQGYNRDLLFVYYRISCETRSFRFIQILSNQKIRLNCLLTLQSMMEKWENRFRLSFQGAKDASQYSWIVEYRILACWISISSKHALLLHLRRGIDLKQDLIRNERLQMLLHRSSFE